ncbi:MAG: hypothetical protein IH853_04975 [Bacteroidetes bacterium]|nr:hypothetical protein [Bacteroidota bacterium]
MAQAIVYTNGHGKLIEYDPINEEWPAGRSIDIGNVMDDFEISALRLKMYAIRVHLLLPLLESSCRFKRRDASALLLELTADALKEGEEYKASFNTVSLTFYQRTQ